MNHLPVRFVHRHSSMATKVTLLLALVLATGCLITLGHVQLEQKQQIALLQEQAAGLLTENEQLEQDIAALGTVGSVRRIAQEELGLAEPGTVVFAP